MSRIASDDVALTVDGLDIPERPDWYGKTPTKAAPLTPAWIELRQAERAGATTGLIVPRRLEAGHRPRIPAWIAWMPMLLLLCATAFALAAWTGHR